MESKKGSYSRWDLHDDELGDYGKFSSDRLILNDTVTQPWISHESSSGDKRDDLVRQPTHIKPKSRRTKRQKTSYYVIHSGDSARDAKANQSSENEPSIEQKRMTTKSQTLEEAEKSLISVDQ